MHTVILCIGNSEGGDDAVGPYIASQLKSTKNRTIIDAGISPENYTGVIRKKKPQLVIIIDAVDMQLSPGEVRIIPEHLIGTMHVSTHNTPISVLIKYLKTFIEKAILIGIQPLTMRGQLTEPVQVSADQLVKIIKQGKILSLKRLK